jgi:predicted ATPase/tRNA A-37 threonylcarbamoyl transferase component Bud32
MIGKTVAHYRITMRLGGGGMGEVYHAYDTKLERPVALKFLNEKSSQNRSLVERFLREARAASALNHPNIITVHDIGETAEGRFMVMELIEGSTLRDLANKERPSAETLVQVAIQVAKALATAHSAGIIHRDIKPENIMVRSDGYVKVLDFGLAHVMPEFKNDTITIEGTDPGTLLGTVRYMSPEQGRGEAVRTASDIFSLGIVLYELAAGAHPFPADSQIETLHAIMVQPPLPPSRLNPAVPVLLESLILQMLEKDSRARPTAKDILMALESGGPSVARRAEPAVAAPGRHTVGRRKEMQELHAGFEFASSKRGLFLCVAGEAGIGKTTIVEDFLSDVAAGGAQPCLIARGRCSERLAGAEAYLPFLEAFENLLHSPSRELVAHTMKVTAPTWYVQVAPLAGDDSSLSRMLAESKPTTQERMKRELIAFLQELSRIKPLVLFFDDLHWSDLSTVDLLAYIGSKCESLRLLMLLTYRPTDLLLNKHPFLPVKLDLQGRGVCREILLEFLTLEDVERYLALEFPEHRFPQEFSRLIHSKTEGSPLFITDLVRYLRERQVIALDERPGGHWVLAQTMPDIQKELPESVRSMIQRKIDQLSDTDRRLLVAGGVQGYEFDAAVVARVLQMDPGDVEEHLEILDRVHAFVRLASERELPDRTLTQRYRFVHILYQNTLYQALGPTRKASLSAAVAGALAVFYGDRANEIASELALLYETARDFTKATSYFLTAAQNAAKLFANQESVLLCRRALELLKTLPDTPERSRQELAILITLGVPLMAIQGYGSDEVERTYARARELCAQLGESPALGNVLWGLFVFYLVRGNLTVADEYAQRIMLRAEQSGDPALLITARWALGVTHVCQGKLRTGYDYLEQGSAIYDPAQHHSYSVLLGLDPGVRIRSESSRSLWLLGYPDQALKCIEGSIELARGLRHPPNIVFPLVFAGMAHQLRREPRLAEQRAEAAIALSREHGLPQFLAWALSWHGWALAEQGRGEEGVVEIRQSLEAHRKMGFNLSRTHFLALLAEALVRMGNLDEASAVVAEALDVAATGGEHYYEAELLRLNGELLLHADADHPQAEACFLRAIEVAREQGAKSLELRSAVSLTRLLRRRGDKEPARPLIEIYNWFREGFETADLIEAKDLLTTNA